MTNDERFAALLGFAFAAAWVGLGFGEAILCLVGAAVFYLVARFTAGELELEDMRERVEGARTGFRRPQATQPQATQPQAPRSPATPNRTRGAETGRRVS
jgi:hypothetical protein